MSDAPSALIAEDEPLLARALQAELARAWPALHIAATVGDGASAVREALARQPDVLFFDIRMPGLSGLDAAAQLADAWPQGGRPFPALVFVTAYDQYAVQAFEAQAVDYLLKPVQPERLLKTVARVQQALGQRPSGGAPGEDTLAQLRHLLGSLLPAASPMAMPVASPAAPDSEPARARQTTSLLPAPAAAPGEAPQQGPLAVIQASVGAAIRMVPVDEVLYFEAADKYVRVLTAEHEYLIRTPLKELAPRLDAQVFWQVHRGTIVRAVAIDAVTRDDAGKLHLRLRGRPESLAVSRLYAHLFKAM